MIPQTYEGQMATGYTHALKEMNYDVGRWLKESLIRGMGVCVVLRDEGDLAEEEIAAKLDRQSRDTYEERALVDIKKELADLKNTSDKELKARFLKEQQDAKLDYECRVEEFRIGKQKHLEALNEIRRLQDLAKKDAWPETSVVRGTLEFAENQLASTLKVDYSDTGPYIPDITKKTFNEWKTTKLIYLQDRVIDYTARIEANKARLENRGDMYRHFVKFVNDAGGEACTTGLSKKSSATPSGKKSGRN